MSVAVSRRGQRLGLLVASGLVGLTAGGMFGLVVAGLRRRHLVTAGPWLTSLRVGLVAWLSVAFLPALKYPANPPGVGDPATIGVRTAWYLTTVAVCVVTSTATWLASRRLRARSLPPAERHLAAAAVVSLGLGVLILLPASSEPVAVPAVLLWEFRLASIGTSATLWLGLAVVFGLLAELADRRGRA